MDLSEMGHRLREPDFDGSDQRDHQLNLIDGRSGVHIDRHS